jgi:Cys-rich four helix bundle protein (predicted Tat secretion target)
LPAGHSSTEKTSASGVKAYQAHQNAWKRQGCRAGYSHSYRPIPAIRLTNPDFRQTIARRLFVYIQLPRKRNHPTVKEITSMSDGNSQTIANDAAGISRREMLLGMGAVAALAYSGNAVSAMPGHDHSKHTVQQPDLLDAMNNCLDKGQRCITHCLVSFKEGDITLADCAAKVHEMRAICDAFSYLLTANSVYVRAYAPICEQACADCKKECLKHKEHIECKACADACEAVIDQIALSLK